MMGASKMALRDVMIGKMRLLPAIFGLLFLAGMVVSGLTIGWGWTFLWVVLAFGISAGVNAAMTNKKNRVAADAQALAPHRPGAETVQVREYASAQEYEADAQKRVAAGWSIQGQSNAGGNIAPGGTAAKAVVFLPWALLSPSRKSGTATVVWVRTE
jgi:hypothetical protein